MQTMIAGHACKLIIFKTFPKNYKIITGLTLHYKSPLLRLRPIKTRSTERPKNQSGENGLGISAAGVRVEVGWIMA